MAQYAAIIPGWDEVAKLADALLSLVNYVTNRQANQIKQLYYHLEYVDKKHITFTGTPPHPTASLGRITYSFTLKIATKIIFLDDF